MTRRSLILVAVLTVAFIAAGILGTAASAGPAPEITAAPKLQALSGGVRSPIPLPPVVYSETITLIATKDSWINEARPTFNYGSATTLSFGFTGAERAWTLLDFDMRQLPADAVVTGAILHLEPGDVRALAPSAPQPYVIPRGITSRWSETTVTWSTGISSQYLSDPQAPYKASGTTSIDVSNIVLGWEDGSLASHGILLTPASGNDTGLLSWSSRTTRKPPTLEVTYYRLTTYQVEKDTYVDSLMLDTNYGSESYLYVGEKFSPDSFREVLLGFPPLPDNIGVISATLKLFPILFLAGSAPETATFSPPYAEALLDSWGESTVTWRNKPPSSNRGPTPFVYYQNTWNEFDVTPIITDWGNGTVEQHGILLTSDPDIDFVYPFYGIPYGNRAQLTVAYAQLPPPCAPLTGVDISGPTKGLTGSSYTFSAQLQPGDADPPFTYSWTATDHAGAVTTAKASYSWSTAGAKTITLEVTNCGGAVSDTLPVSITQPPPSCPNPISGLALDGPVVIPLSTPRTFTATVSPANATTPITYTWQATGKSESNIISSSATSTGEYSWAAAGSKQIAVTAVQCGGEFTQYLNVEVIDTASLPDLNLASFWYEQEESRVGYLLSNDGQSTAPAGHLLEFSQGSTVEVQEQYSQPLAAGAIRAGYLDHTWSCAGESAGAVLTADRNDIIAELWEANNQKVIIWPCDMDPPIFTAGPLVTDETETTVRVVWQTNESTTGDVYYSRYSAGNMDRIHSSANTLHSKILTDLQPATTYRLFVAAEDSAGQKANSETIYFDTAPPGTDPPTIDSLAITPQHTSSYEFWKAEAQIADSAYLDRVEFRLNGTLIGTDYGDGDPGQPDTYSVLFSPYALGYTPDTFFDQPLSLTAKAINLSGSVTQSDESVTLAWEDRQIELEIAEPADGFEILAGPQGIPQGVTQPISIAAYQFDWGCTWSGFSEPSVLPPGQSTVQCDNVKQPVDHIIIYVDDVRQATLLPTSGEYFFQDTLGLAGLALGDHDITVSAFASGSPLTTVTHTLKVTQGEPIVTAARQVSRRGNVLDVFLAITNIGNYATNFKSVKDAVIGLNVVPIQGGDFTSTRTSSYFFNTYQRREHWEFAPVAGDVTLDPDESITMTYSVVPILHERPAEVDIGGLPVKILTSQFGVETETTVPLPAVMVDDDVMGMIHIDMAIARAIFETDYLIVTNPWRLQEVLGGAESIAPLLTEMAELAALKNGVIGYLYDSTTQYVLDDLIELSGAWANRMNGAFKRTDEGYVLIVGETEIIPAFYHGSGDFTMGIDPDLNFINDVVHDSDLKYADTRGETHRPELVVGRIIGNDIERLRLAIQTSVHIAQNKPGYSFERDRAMVVSGRGSGVTSDFIPTINLVADALDDEFEVSKIHLYDYDGEAQYTSVFSATLPDQDLVMWFGHGSYDGWTGNTVTTWSPGIMPRGGSNPVVFAAACKNGNYEEGDDYNMPDGHLRNHYSVFIGSTENSMNDANVLGIKTFARRWDPGETVGETLNSVKRHVWDDDIGLDHGKLWAYEYNLYGDPKMGRPLDGAGPAAPLTSEQALAEQAARLSPIGGETMTLALSLPDLLFTPAGGETIVELPGGGMLREVGAYNVPTWLVHLPLPAGQRLQDVQLAGRSLPESYTGYQLPTADGDISCGVCAQPAVPQVDLGEWYPELSMKYDWTVEEAEDGGSMVYLRVFPVYYHISSTSLIYYQNITFTLETITTTVTADQLGLNAPVLPLRKPLHAALSLSNSGVVTDVIVAASIRTMAQGHEVAGLPLRVLHGLSGTAEVEFGFDTRLIDPGSYRFHVELLDTQGNILDTITEGFQSGTWRASLAELNASADIFAPGDTVNLTAVISNTGSNPITGTAIFMLQSSGAVTYTEMLTTAVDNLAAGSSLPIAALWDSSQAPFGQDMHVVAYLKYASNITEPKALDIPTWHHVFLPAIIRQ